MSIDVEVFGQLLGGKRRRETLPLPHPVSVLEVANILGLQPEDVGLITVDGVQSEMPDTVRPGSRVCFFPPMSGG